MKTLYVCIVWLKVAQAKFRTAKDNHTMKYKEVKRSLTR